MARISSFNAIFSAVAGVLLSMGAPASAAGGASFEQIDDFTLLSGSPLHIPLDGLNSGGQALTYSISVVHVSGDADVSAYVPEGNRSMRISVAGYGDMILELFEDRAPRVTDRIITLAESGFYDGVIFHRVINDFMIQGGDPTGTGTGGSTLGDFDDQFRLDLQHNTSGVLSMAKSSDDTNDSQFFITEVPTRHLDYNHSIFGRLVEGESVRDAISDTPATDSKPDSPVVMSSVSIFNDTDNAVLMIKAPEGTSGTADVTVTVTDEDSNQYQQTFRVTVTPDTENSNPFLADIPDIVTSVDSPVQLQLVAFDVEGDSAQFLDEQSLDSYGLDVPVWSHADLDYSVDFDTGLLTVTPKNGLTGVHPITVATGASASGLDYQVVDVMVVSGLLPGDSNGDGLVNDNDFSNMKSNYGQAGIWSQGDFNADSLIDGQDFTILKASYEAPEGAAGVPEPATLSLLVLGGLAVLCRKRRFGA